MILDAQLMLSDEQDIGQVVGTYVSTNVLDTWTLHGAQTALPTIPVQGGAVPNNIGDGTPIPIFLQIVEAVTSATTGALQVQVIESDSANMGTPTVLCQTAVLAKATLVAGYQPLLPFVPRASKRYVAVQYDISSATTTAGTINCFIGSPAGSAPGTY